MSDFSAFSQGRADVIAQVLLPYTASSVHRHSSYEVIYVLRGGYMFSFEGDERRISAGDSVIITSGSRHSFSALGEDSFAMRFFISDSAFRNSMSSVMESQDILAEFIKTAVSNIDVPNYLLISTGGSSSVNSVAKHLLLEQFRYDSYSPMCTMNWLRLFFANLMRSCIHYYQHSIGQGRIDFARILGYIDENYKTASLGELSRRFNYSVSYLSETIKTATGRNFSDIICERKLDDAKKYLEYTGMTVMEISEACGFQSADTFSRSFKNYFDVTPSGYRKALRAGKQT